jgi:hypothetical protein
MEYERFSVSHGNENECYVLRKAFASKEHVVIYTSKGSREFYKCLMAAAEALPV